MSFSSITRVISTGRRVSLVMQEHEGMSVFNGSYQYDTSQYKFIKTN
jgi:hypothetical protein